VGDSFYFELPFLFADIGLNDGVLLLSSLKLSSHLSLDVAATKIKVFVNIVSTLLSMNLVGHVSVTFHVIVVIISFIFTSLTFVSNHWCLKLEPTGKTSFGQLEKYKTDTISIS